MPYSWRLSDADVQMILTSLQQVAWGALPDPRGRVAAIEDKLRADRLIAAAKAILAGEGAIAAPRTHRRTPGGARPSGTADAKSTTSEEDQT